MTAYPSRRLLPALRPAAVMLAVSMLLFGALYPALVMGLAKALFAHQAQGSLIERSGAVIGSELIGQPFASMRYFWGRPSATAPPYNAAASGGSNVSPGNPALREAAAARLEKLRQAHPNGRRPAPADLLTASASGLDPHISIEAAEYQVVRVARARGMSEREVRRLVEEHVQPLQFGLLGKPRVNVLKLNLALDERSGR